jgi:hypothetical protein
MTMTYLACAFSLLLGMYSIPFSLAMIKHNYKMTDFTFMEKIQNIIVLFLVATFPLINFASAIEIFLFRSYIFSYISGAYGFVFITFYFLDRTLSTSDYFR